MALICLGCLCAQLSAFLLLLATLVFLMVFIRSSIEKLLNQLGSLFGRNLYEESSALSLLLGNGLFLLLSIQWRCRIMFLPIVQYWKFYLNMGLYCLRRLPE